jgi:hypothetical protein
MAPLAAAALERGTVKPIDPEELLAKIASLA